MCVRLIVQKTMYSLFKKILLYGPSYICAVSCVCFSDVWILFYSLHSPRHLCWYIVIESRPVVVLFLFWMLFVILDFTGLVLSAN